MLLHKFKVFFEDEENRSGLLYSLVGGGILLFIFKKIRNYLKKKQTQDEMSKVKVVNQGFVNLIKSRINAYNKNCKIRKESEKIISKYSYPSGLVNYGSTCYINCFLQSISSLPEFMYYSSFECQDLIQNFLSLLFNINTSPLKVLYPDEIISDICEKFEFANEQQDSYELFHRIMDLYHTKKNPLEVIFETTYHCPNCKMVSISIFNLC